MAGTLSCIDDMDWVHEPPAVLKVLDPYELVIVPLSFICAAIKLLLGFAGCCCVSRDCGSVPCLEWTSTFLVVRLRRKAIIGG